MSDDEQVDAALSAADVLMGVAARSVMEVDDIVTSPQLRVLVLIAQLGPRTPGDVASELGVHASNATRLSDKLVRAGLVERSEDPGDRRFVRLSLTGSGRQLVERVIGHRRQAIADVLGAMPPADRAAAVQAFAAFARAAGAVSAADAAPGDDGRFTLVPPSPSS